MLELVVKLSHCDLQICIMILCGFYLFCQCGICSSQLSHLELEMLNFQFLADLQVKNVEGILCSSCQLFPSYVSSEPGWIRSYVLLVFQHSLTLKSPRFICLIVNRQE